MDQRRDAELTGPAISQRQFGAVADEQQARRYLLTDPIEDRHHRVETLHRPEIRDVGHDLRRLVTTGEPLPEVGTRPAAVHRAVEEVRNDSDVPSHAELV